MDTNAVRERLLQRRDELRQLEPEVRCVAGFASPSTGIIDSHALMLSLLMFIFEAVRDAFDPRKVVL